MSAGASPRVAFQGERGAYSEDAILARWGSAARPVPARENLDVALAVERGLADYGVLAVENTLAGSVVASYDALAATNVVVTGEIVIPIHHCLLAPAGATVATLRSVESHPIALAQCRRFLAAHPHVEPRASYDTGGAARAVADRGDVTRGAIAGRAAAWHFELSVLATGIEDRPDNQTRFVVLAREPEPLAIGTPARTALIVETDDVPGALLRVLEPFATAGLNLSKLESRPTGTPWAYRFFLELEHDAGDPAAARALDSLRAVTRSLRLLGSFARDDAAVMEPAMEERAHG
ncbi:MAG TPA: prephenate dehydratase [Gemmatimonadales bacterium]